MYSLKLKLSLSYIAVILVCVTMISILTNLLLDKQFSEYIKQNQEKSSVDIVSSLTKQFKMQQKWDIQVIENIGLSALEDGYIIKVKDNNEKIIWDATKHNQGMCQQMIEKMAYNMNSRYPSFKGGYIEKNYKISYDKITMGSVDIGYYGPFYLNDRDLGFINTLNKLFIGVGIFSLLFALVLGTMMARRLSMPISRVVDSVQHISKGYFGDGLTENSTTKEIYQLTNAVNSLARTLEDQETLRKKLTEDVAHELRTPLSTLQSHLEAMIDGIWKADRERLKSCHEEIIRLNRMVGDLEKLTKYESENLVLNKSKFNISETIKRILQNFENEFITKDINTKFINKSQNVFADKDKISQVMVNLISNALKYTQNGGTVEIIVDEDSYSTKIIIKDNGIGISEQDIPYIFERFYRADKSRNRQTGGAGIGLTIAKAIISAHKGDIKLYSKQNVGTEIIITLPKINA